MTAYSGGSPADVFGEAPLAPPVPSEFASWWPPGEPGIAAAQPSHQQSTTPRQVEGPPDSKGNRKRKKVPAKKPPGAYKTTRTKPGADQVDRSGRVQQGR